MQAQVTCFHGNFLGREWPKGKCEHSEQETIGEWVLGNPNHRIHSICLICLPEIEIKEGGKADLVSSRLRAGDEVVNINEVALSSSRREAVSLVKGSYKTLRLVVRRLEANSDMEYRPITEHVGCLVVKKPPPSSSHGI
ncbi:hypothetical protein MJG53_005777 [Ovis ammon polii x Ovis aries]|uniref:PDZ domain-containing protein n=2 Tax=Ovis TaxID=9935 RepID=A0AAD4YDT8_OVIAM|nr:hypothetical protein MG293_006942 [Ovis ammon polii]KAI4572277.1 hypothetical protein MJT46_005345 [Ovis ammon polii x Ovis aries]KAI4585543.1 hypothetical protein MJG53_005777 [Ovis ammon polii x Ovis aries]